MRTDLKIRHLKIRRAYPLNTKLEQKIEDAHHFHGWTIFLNNRHTLAHILHSDYPDGYFRLTCKKHHKVLKQSSEDQLLLYFFARISKQLII